MGAEADPETKRVKRLPDPASSRENEMQKEQVNASRKTWNKAPPAPQEDT
jgi:hypothetical protein